MLNKINATVKEIMQHCNDTKSFILQPEKPIAHKAGQFIMLTIPYKDTSVRRAYSIANKPGLSTIEICMNHLPHGKASDFLFNLQGGEQIQIDGPYGIFNLKESKNDKFFVCTGTGIAPLRAMIHQLLHKNPNEHVTLLFGEQKETELLYREELQALALQHSNFTYIPTLSRTNGHAWGGERGYVQQAIKKYLYKPLSTDVYICGLKGMVDDVKAVLLELGVPQQNIFTEKFG
jgi:ferredoxin-NADP reductase